jgi:hypothetical protein
VFKEGMVVVVENQNEEERLRSCVCVLGGGVAAILPIAFVIL